MERCPGQVCLERALRGNEEIDPRLAQARLVVIGIDKGTCAAPRHSLPCMPAGSDPWSERPRCRPEMCRPEGRFGRPSLTMRIREAAKANRYFFSVGGRRAAAAALPRALPRTANDTLQKSAPTPRSHSSWRPRSLSSPSDRLLAGLGGPDAFAAATNTASGSCPDAPGSRRGGCGPTLLWPRRVPPDIGCDRDLPPAALPIAASRLRGGDGRCWSRRSLRH